jgi:hypothetical protein
MRLVRLSGISKLFFGTALLAWTFGCEQGTAPPLSGSQPLPPAPVTPSPSVTPTTTPTTTGVDPTPAPIETSSPVTAAPSTGDALTSGDVSEPGTEPAGDGGVDSTEAVDTQGPSNPADCQAACAAAGATCQDGACVFTCDTDDACPEDIQCPDDFSCRVECTGANSCASKVVCPVNGGESCTIECGQDACKEGVVCGGKSCNVNCANGACTGVSGGADNFTLNCSGDGSCSGAPLSCNAQNCNISCTGSGACMRGDINISANTANLMCQGNGACSQAINCSAGTCNLTCNTGVSACSSYCQNNGGEKPNGCP